MRYFRRRRIRRSRDTTIRRRNKGGERSHILSALPIEPPGNTARGASSKPAAAPTIRSTRQNRVKRQDDLITPQLLSGQADGEGRHPQRQAKRPDTRAKARGDEGAAAVRRWTGSELPPAKRPDTRAKARGDEGAAAVRRWTGCKRCIYSSSSWIIKEAIMFIFMGLLLTCSHEP